METKINKPLQYYNYVNTNNIFQENNQFKDYNRTNISNKFQDHNHIKDKNIFSLNELNQSLQNEKKIKNE